MGTNITNLKKGKGAPPPADDVLDVTEDSARTGKAELRPLQVRIPREVFEAFSEQAGREFGFTHGAKKQMFLKIWREYKAQNM
jgi:hypothetical protein